VLTEKRRFVWVFIASVAILSVVVGWIILRAFKGASANSDAMQRRLRQELIQIPPPKSAREVQYSEVPSIGHGGVSKYFQTDLSYAEITAYYDAELRVRGWIFQRETKLTSWGTDQGELMRFYCKDSISADLYFTGHEEANVGFRYSFGMSWGLYSCDRELRLKDEKMNGIDLRFAENSGRWVFAKNGQLTTIKQAENPCQLVG
jgi:hypothetical protein